MRLDLAITIGDVLQIAAILGGIFMAYGKLKERLISIEERLGPLWDEYKADRRQGPRRVADRDA